VGHKVSSAIGNEQPIDGLMEVAESSHPCKVSKHLKTCDPLAFESNVTASRREMPVKLHLATALEQWQDRLSRVLKGSLNKFRETMMNSKPVIRHFTTFCMIAMVAGIIALCAVAKSPYTGTNSITWHTAKASRMSRATLSVVLKTQTTSEAINPFSKDRLGTSRPFMGSDPRNAKSLVRSGVAKFRSPPFSTRLLPLSS
jgi:hypothetical protein